MIEILLSTYNGEMFIEEQINSILNQSYKEWHLTIRDDGSTDSTASVINRLASENSDRISIINDNKNLGCKKSFETLLANADADYFMFCDQDDVWLPDKVKNAYNTIKSTEKDGVPAIACSDLIVVDSSLKIINNSFFAYSGIKYKKLNSSNMLAVANYVTGCTMIINKRAKEVSLPFGRHAVLHDAWIAQRVIYCGGTITLMPKSDILYRQHNHNTVGATQGYKGLKKVIEKLKGIKSVLKKNIANMKQSKESANVSLPSYLLSKFKYIILP